METTDGCYVVDVFFFFLCVAGAYVCLSSPTRILVLVVLVRTYVAMQFFANIKSEHARTHRPARLCTGAWASNHSDPIGQTIINTPGPARPAGPFTTTTHLSPPVHPQPPLLSLRQPPPPAPPPRSSSSSSLRRRRPSSISFRLGGTITFVIRESVVR